MTVSLRLAPEEAVMFRDYAKLQGKSLSEVFRMALRDKIEEEFELAAVREYEREKKDGTLELLDSKVVWDALGV